MIPIPADELGAADLKDFVAIDFLQPPKEIRQGGAFGGRGSEARDNFAAFGDLELVALAEQALDLLEVIAEVAHGDGFHVIHFSITRRFGRVQRRFPQKIIAFSSPFPAEIGYAVWATRRFDEWTHRNH